MLVDGPDSYVVRTIAADDIEHHAIFEILFTLTDHPMSFLIATDPAVTQGNVLSGQVDATCALLRREPQILGGDRLVGRFHELFRPRAVHSRVLPAPAPSIARQAGTVNLSYTVFIEGEREHWSVVLPAVGKASVRMDMAGELGVPR